MKHASLFSGIGGFDLAAHWAGWANVFQCEIDPFCNRVLEKNFPDVQRYGDIKTTDFRPWCGAVDVLSGGFPCQPYSSAGKRLGKADERHLWPEMLRAIREIEPTWVVGENVRGLVSWSAGLVFEEVCADLESAGYEVQPFVLPAAGVDAPHERQRVWFVAHSTGIGRKTEKPRRRRSDVERFHRNAANPDGSIQRGLCGEPGKVPTEKSIYRHDSTATSNANREWQQQPQGDIEEGGRRSGHCCQVAPDADGQRWEDGVPGPRSSGPNHQPGNTDQNDQWANWPTQPPLCGRDDGVSNRVDSIRVLGNAVVPQEVLQIFTAINRYEQLNP